MAAMRCDKLNVAAIGNVVPQLHIHIVARRHDDALWPKPVWGAAPPRPYDPATLQRFVAAIRERMRGAVAPCGSICRLFSIRSFNRMWDILPGQWAFCLRGRRWMYG